MARKAIEFGGNAIRKIEKGVLLQILDHVWKDHLLTLDYLRHGISLRAYGHRDPLNEFKAEAFNLFHDLLERMRDTTISTLTHLQFPPRSEEEDQEWIKPPPHRPLELSRQRRPGWVGR